MIAMLMVMVGMVLVWFTLVKLVWFVVCSKCEACVHGSCFGYMWDACELCWFSYRWDACELCWFGYRWDACEPY
jgi:hypothetical protein